MSLHQTRTFFNLWAICTFLLASLYTFPLAVCVLKLCVGVVELLCGCKFMYYFTNLMFTPQNEHLPDYFCAGGCGHHLFLVEPRGGNGSKISCGAIIQGQHKALQYQRGNMLSSADESPNSCPGFVSFLFFAALIECACAQTYTKTECIAKKLIRNKMGTNV